MTSWDKTKLAPLLLAAVVLGLSCLLLVLSSVVPAFGVLQRLEWLTYDWRMREAARFAQPAAPNLAFVGIDDDSVDWLGEGKLLGEPYGLLWPRHIYGRLVRELSAQQAKVVALDVLFGELRPDHPSVELPDKSRVKSDDFFAAELRRAGNVVLGADTNVVPVDGFRTNAWALGDISNQPDADGILRRLPAFRTCYSWNPLFKSLARKYDQKLILEPRRVLLLNPTNQQTELAIPIDEDGYFKLEDLTGKKEAGFTRLLPAYTRIRSWHMGIVLAARELSLDLEHAVVEPRHLILRGPGGIRRVIPLDDQGRFYVDWSLPPNDPRLIQANIEHVLGQDLLRLSGQAAGLTNRFRDTLVTVGSAATGSNLSDMGATPLSSKTLLVSTHWNVANMIITDRFVRLAPLPAALALVLGLGVVSAWLTWQVRSGWASVWVGAVVLAYVAIAVVLFVRFRCWLPLVLPVGGGALLTHVCLTIYRAVFEQHEHRRIRKVFAKIVSPNVVQELLRAERLSLGGARRSVTVLFVDVRGFTELSDFNQTRAEEYIQRHRLAGAEAERHINEQARVLLETVNLYLGNVADIVKRHNGTLDKYIGDCVMAFWGAPTPNESHALACVRAALDVQRAIETLNQERRAANQKHQVASPTPDSPESPLLDLLYVGCGINSGVVTVGLMGSDAHLVNYTVFGREVNVASRLEGLSGRGHIVIGESTYAEIRRDDPALAATCIELPAVAVKGIRAPVKAYEVPWKTPGHRPE